MDERRRNRLEDLRQLEHAAPIGFAFLLPYLPYWAVLSLAGLAILHALVLSPRVVRITTRSGEGSVSRGKVYYALGVLALLLVFSDRLEIAAGVWAILAVGDAASNVFGRRWGRRPLPFNPSKSVFGTGAYWISGTLSATLLVWWNMPEPASLWQIGAFSCIAAFLCALAEGLPAVLDDNLATVWVGGVSFALLFSIPSPWPVPGAPWWEGLAVTVSVAVISRLLGWVSLRGTILATVFGILVYGSWGMPAFATLLLFLVLGSLSTRLGLSRKKQLGIAESDSGQRGIVNVLANGMVPFLLAILAYWIPFSYLKVAFAAAVATAAMDTVSTEIGQVLGRHPFNPVTFRPAAVGTQGAISVEGTLAGLVAALSVASLPVVLLWLPPASILAVGVAAVAANFYESISASVFRYGFPHSDEALNLYSTLFGATTGGLLWIALEAVL